MRSLRVAAQAMVRGTAWLAASTCLLVPAGCQPPDDSGEPATMVVLYPATGVREFLDQEGQFVFLLPLVGLSESGTLEGRLARRWEHTPDRRAWTVWLRSDVRWHDGAPVTANDIAFTVELLSRPDVGYISPGTVDIAVIDDSTFVYSSTVTSPLSDYRTYYPEHLLEELDPTKFYEWEFWTEPVGNGPYRYVQHLPKTMMELESNPDYFRGEPIIERVVLRFGEPQLIELLAGNVDALTSVSPMDLPKIANDSRFDIHYQYGFDTQSIYWNHRTDLFRDARVRRALTLAINRRELLEVLNLSVELPLFDVIFSQRQWDDLPEPHPFSQLAAGCLLLWGIHRRRARRSRLDRKRP